MKTVKKSSLHLLPTAGLTLFLALYVLAACLYPGGSRHDPSAAHFSVLHNYWCDLFDVVAQNGRPNRGRPVAIAAMFELTATLALFWYSLPRCFVRTAPWQVWVRRCGVASALGSTLLFTSLHEAVIYVAGPLGTIAFGLSLAALYRDGRPGLMAIGLLGILLCAVNFWIYHTGTALFVLPVIQKMAFLVFFGWVVSVNVTTNKGFHQA